MGTQLQVVKLMEFMGQNRADFTIKMGEIKKELWIQNRSPIPCQFLISRVCKCWWGPVTAVPPSLAPLKHVNLTSRTRETSWVQSSSERLCVPWVWLNPAFAVPSLVEPENCYLKVLFWRYFWRVWNTGKLSGIRSKGRPDAKKHKECYGDITAFCDIPVLSRNPKMPCYRTRLGTANGGKDLKSSEAAEVH